MWVCISLTTGKHQAIGLGPDIGQKWEKNKKVEFQMAGDHVLCRCILKAYI